MKNNNKITSPLALTLTVLALNLPIIQNAQADSFINVGSMITGRYVDTATLLSNGQVLIAGGYNVTNYLSRCELYDPASGTWIETKALSKPLRCHTATLLTNGLVLLAGGFTPYSRSSMLYDPASGTWTPSGMLNTARDIHSATLLTNGQVLIVGGHNGGSYTNTLSSAELYDPAGGQWTLTASLNVPRRYHTATLLLNGQVLVAGGIYNTYLSTAELYDPSSKTWRATARMSVTRDLHTATLLPNGKVLVAGGMSSNGARSITELYDPATELWTTTGSLNTARYSHTETLLTNGWVLVTGGLDSGNACLSSAELYNPSTGTWTVTDALNIARKSHTATLLANGQVLIEGGYDGAKALSSAELYDAGLPPAAPRILSAVGGNAQVALSWTISPGATSFNVKSSTLSDGPYTTITNVISANYTNIGLTSGKTYYYVVTAINANGESAKSPQVYATTWESGLNLSYTVKNGSFICNSSNNLPFAASYLLTSTDLLTPPSQWQCIATNWCDASGSLAFTNLLDPNEHQRFYKLKSQ